MTMWVYTCIHILVLTHIDILINKIINTWKEINISIFYVYIDWVIEYY